MAVAWIWSSLWGFCRGEETCALVSSVKLLAKAEVLCQEQPLQGQQTWGPRACVVDIWGRQQLLHCPQQLCSQVLFRPVLPAVWAHNQTAAWHLQRWAERPFHILGSQVETREGVKNESAWFTIFLSGCACGWLYFGGQIQISWHSIMDTSTFIGAAWPCIFEDGFASGLIFREGRCGGKDTVVYSDLWPQPHFKVVIVFGWPLGYGLPLSAAGFSAVLRVELSRTPSLHTITKVLRPSSKMHSRRPWSSPPICPLPISPIRGSTQLHTSPSRGGAQLHAGVGSIPGPKAVPAQCTG